MIRLRLVPVVVSLAFCVARLVSAAESSAGELAQVRRQFCEFYLGSEALPAGNLTLKDTNEAPPDVRRATDFLHALRADGTWADIRYQSPARSAWPPAIHYTRMLAMAAAARRSGTPPADAAALIKGVHAAFAAWIARDPHCENWWYNQIGGPKLLATTALLLDDALLDSERRYLVETIMPRAKIGMTGQNRVWLAGNTLMLALLKPDRDLVNAAAETIWSEVAVTTQEGIQPDFSFHQHGPQQQFGNYGMALAVEICRWGTILRGTPWAMPPAKLAAYRGFLLDGEAWVNWRGVMDIGACGRQFMPHAPEAKARTIAQVMGNVAVFDPARATDYRGFITRNASADATNDLTGLRVFWRSDYVIDRRRDWMTALKMSSRRVVGAELVNSENLLGYHLGDGAFFLYATGREYEDIFPVWDWQKLPGVTCAQLPGGLPKYSQMRGAGEFVGGVTDGDLGCAALEFSRDGVHARKAWFFGSNRVLCLGAAIASSGNDPVLTSVNQCRLHGDVTVKRVGQTAEVMARGDHVLADVEWVQHDGWRYDFPGGATVHLRVGPQTGNWHRVFNNPDTPPADVTHDVFSLWIDHAGPDSRYAYAISRAGAAMPAAAPPFSNTAARQAAELGGGAGAAVFWQAGEAELAPGVRVAVDQPSLVVLGGGGARAFVSDPTQKLAHLTLTVNGVPHGVSLPREGHAGESVEVNLAAK